MSAVAIPLGVVAGALVLLLAAVWFLQRRMIYFPTGSPPPVNRVLPGAHEVRLVTADGLTLNAWFLPATDSDLDATVLVANGNGGHRGDRADLARALAAAGMSVLLFDYRGYGGNSGRPTERGLALDVRAARDYVIDELGISAERLLYLGESLGCAVVVELATEHPAGGLLLRSPFVGLAEVAGRHYPFLPVRAMLRDRYRLLDHLLGIRVPTTVVLGTADEVVPPDQSRTVAETAPVLVDLVTVRDAKHNDAALVAGPALIQAAVNLARRTAP